MMKEQKGLILIELIMTIVLMGIIATFVGFFIFSGINGYLRAKEINNSALDAQRALDRISLELRYIDYFTSAPVVSPAANPSLSYKSLELSGARRFWYDSTNKVLLIGKVGNEQPLLENVSPFTMTIDWKKLENEAIDPDDEAGNINVEFNIEGIGSQFRTRVFPRNMVPKVP